MTTFPPDPQNPAGGNPGGYEQPPSGPAYGGYPPAQQQYGGGRPPLADWPQRVGAYLIDALIVFAIIIPFAIIGGAADSPALLALGYLAAIGFYVYQLVQQGTTGQTIGKKTLGIRLLREQDGQPIGAGLSIARYFVHFVDAIPCYIGYLWPLWDEKKQTFADKILGTVVVKS